MPGINVLRFTDDVGPYLGRAPQFCAETRDPTLLSSIAMMRPRGPRVEEMPVIGILSIGPAGLFAPNTDSPVQRVSERG